MKDKDLLYKKLNALRLEVSGAIVDDIIATADAVFKDDGKPNIDAAFTRFDLEKAHIAGWNNLDFEDWFQEHLPKGVKCQNCGSSPKEQVPYLACDECNALFCGKANCRATTRIAIRCDDCGAFVSRPTLRTMSDNKPDWKDAPEWANWLAQDGDGEWWWYQNAPDRSSYLSPLFAVFFVLLWTGKQERPQSYMFWYRTYGKAGVAMISEPNPNWRKTLEARP